MMQTRLGVPSKRRWNWTVGGVASGESGQTLVEFAVSLGLLLTSVFTLMELSLLFYTYSTISECAREGSRYAMVRGSTCTTGAGASCTASATAVNTYVSGLKYPNPGGGAMSVNTTYSADGITFTTTGNNAPNDFVRVNITYTFPIRMPFVPKKSLSLSAQSQMYILQ
jgi:Flp pilus assembly protein TadG